MEDVHWGGANHGQGQGCCILTHWSGYVGWETSLLASDPMTIQEGRWAIAQAITDCQVKARGPGHPCVNPLTQQPFRFDCSGGSPLKNTPGEVGSDHRPSPHQSPQRPRSQ